MMMQAFNQWLHDDWTFNYENTIFAAPYIALGDVDAAVAEVDKVLGMGANVLVMRPAPVTTRTGVVSPFNPMFDPVWARINESGVPLVIHAADSGYSSQGYADDAFSSLAGGGGAGPSLKGFAIERAAQDWLIQAVFEKIFDRFPNLRFASIENGSDFLARCSGSSIRPPRSRTGGLTTIRSTRSSSTFGSIRSGKTTSMRSSNSWVPIG